MNSHSRIFEIDDDSMSYLATEDVDHTSEEHALEEEHVLEEQHEGDITETGKPTAAIFTAAIFTARNPQAIDPEKVSFNAMSRSLSALERNQIYRNVLCASGLATIFRPGPEGIRISYSRQTHGSQEPDQYLLDQDGLRRLGGLSTLSSLNWQTRHEARTWFFSNTPLSLVRVWKPDRIWTEMGFDPVEKYVEFLQIIDWDGRAYIRSLQMNLYVSRAGSGVLTKAENIQKLWELLGECVRLEDLDITLPISCFYAHDHLAMTRFFKGRGSASMPDHPHSGVAKQLRKLTQLKSLKITPVTDYRYIPLRAEITNVNAIVHLGNKGRLELSRHRQHHQVLAIENQLMGFLRGSLSTFVVIDYTTFNYLIPPRPRTLDERLYQSIIFSLGRSCQVSCEPSP